MSAHIREASSTPRIGMVGQMGMLDIEPSENGEASLRQGEASSLRRRSQQLQSQIAEALGLPVSAFRQPETIRASPPDALDAAQADVLAMNRDCTALIDAFTRISDPRERRRLLEIVRDAVEAAAKT